MFFANPVLIATVGDLVGRVGGPGHPRVTGDVNDLGAEGSHQAFLLLAEPPGDDEHRPEAELVGGDRHADAGVPGGRFDDRPAGRDVAAVEERFEDVFADAVLHAAAGVERLQLGVDADPVGGGVEVDERGGTDGVEERCARLGVSSHVSGSWEVDREPVLASADSETVNNDDRPGTARRNSRRKDQNPRSSSVSPAVADGTPSRGRGAAVTRRSRWASRPVWLASWEGVREAGFCGLSFQVGTRSVFENVGTRFGTSALSTVN